MFDDEEFLGGAEATTFDMDHLIHISICRIMVGSHQGHQIILFPKVRGDVEGLKGQCSEPGLETAISSSE